MDKIRIPTRWLKQIAHDVEEGDEQTMWEFTSEGGNVMRVVRTIGVKPSDCKDTIRTLDVLDFIYNPDD